MGMARRASGGHGQAGKRVASTSATMSTSPITVCASQGVRRLPVHRTCANTVCCVQLIRFSRGGRCACVGVASEGRLLCSVGAALASGSGGFRSSGTMCSEWVPEQWYYVFRGFRSSGTRGSGTGLSPRPRCRQVMAPGPTQHRWVPEQRY